MPRTLLITGAAGFIGSTFAAQSLEKGDRVIVLDALTYAGHEENLSWIPHVYELVKGSITDGALVSKLLKDYQVDAVVDFAAESHVDNSITGPGAFIDTNIIGCYTMLEAARQYWLGLAGAKKNAFRFVHISTDEVYGSLGPTGKFTEESPKKPNSPYSASKAAGDHLCRAWFETYGLPVIVTNCTNNYGPRHFPEKLIPLMISRALAGQPMPVYGDGQNIRDWIHVEDHCRGIRLALEKGQPGETYAFGGDAEKNNLDVVHAICDLLDEMKPLGGGKTYRSQIAFVQDRAGHDRRYAIDDSKAQRELGFKREYKFDTGLRATIQWYLDNQNWCQSVTKKAKAA